MKKNIKLTVILTILSLSVFGQGIDFSNLTWDENLQKAKKENKLIMLDAMASWCGPCKTMSKKTFTNEEVGTFFNENFICIKMDMEKNEAGPKLSSKYGLRAYPTIYFIDGDGNKIHQSVGYLTPNPFIKEGKTALEKYQPQVSEEENFIFCEECEKKIDASANFCNHCGTEVYRGSDLETEIDFHSGIFSDTRNGKEYKTVTIGNYTWMAENLNYKTKKGSVCYEKKSKNCEQYGRLYTYEVALEACPNGWHLATVDEWNDLVEFSGGVESLTDIDGFAALPAGLLAGGDMKSENDDYFVNINSISAFWADHQDKKDKYGAYYYMWKDGSDINYDKAGFLSEKNSVRCVKDTE